MNWFRLGRRFTDRLMSMFMDSRTGLVILHNLNIVSREETVLSTSVNTQPPIFVHHLNLRHELTLSEFNFVVLGLLVVELDLSPNSALGMIRSGGFGGGTAKVLGLLEISLVRNGLLQAPDGHRGRRSVLLLVSICHGWLFNTAANGHRDLDGGALADGRCGGSGGARLRGRSRELLLTIMLFLLGLGGLCRPSRESRHRDRNRNGSWDGTIGLGDGRRSGLRGLLGELVTNIMDVRGRLRRLSRLVGSHISHFGGRPILYGLDGSPRLASVRTLPLVLTAGLALDGLRWFRGGSGSGSFTTLLGLAFCPELGRSLASLVGKGTAGAADRRGGNSGRGS
jgi:hypothetical protein